MKELQELFNLMTSADYRDRFVAEYLQISIRRNRLAKMLLNYKEGNLNFTPKCSYELLYEQLIHMESYMEILEQRAVIEDIPLIVGVNHG